MALYMVVHVLCSVGSYIRVKVSESLSAVEGGHRAIIFSRISGVQKKILAEGIHFRYS